MDRLTILRSALILLSQKITKETLSFFSFLPTSAAMFFFNLLAFSLRYLRLIFPFIWEHMLAMSDWKYLLLMCELESVRMEEKSVGNARTYQIQLKQLRKRGKSGGDTW